MGAYEPPHPEARGLIHECRASSDRRPSTDYCAPLLRRPPTILNFDGPCARERREACATAAGSSRWQALDLTLAQATRNPPESRLCMPARSTRITAVGLGVLLGIPAT